ncbi:MAG: hypothetical protein AAF526_00110 [Pseudomonadota bacterium]
MKRMITRCDYIYLVGEFYKLPLIHFFENHGPGDRVKCFYLIDEQNPRPIANFDRVRGISFNEEKIGNFAGEVLGCWWRMRGAPKPPRVVFIGGAGVPAVKRWSSGFENGLAAEFPDHLFIHREISEVEAGFNDYWSAYHLANFAIEIVKADIIVQAAGASCLGIIDALRGSAADNASNTPCLVCCDYPDWDRFRDSGVEFLLSATRSIEAAIMSHTTRGVHASNLFSAQNDFRDVSDFGRIYTKNSSAKSAIKLLIGENYAS